MCTIVAQNYLAQARVLAESYARVAGGRRLQVLVVDGRDSDGPEEPFDVLRPSELALDGVEFRTMAAIYDDVELATSLKPWLLRALLDRGAETAIYLDPDVEVFAALDEAAELAAAHEAVLVPHVLGELPADGLKPSRRDLVVAGTYNLGFIAVGRGGARFLDWWGERLRRDCIVAVEEALFVDQRQLDAAPAYFDVHVLRDPGWDVAYWNLHERELTWNGDAYEVDGRPLRFFHFSGFDPTRPDRLSRHGGDVPRVRVAADSVLERLCRGYARRLHDAGWDVVRRIPYGYGTSLLGTPLDRPTRRLLRAALLAYEAGEADAPPPNPLEPEGAAAFDDWARSPDVVQLLPPLARARWYLDTGPSLASPRRWVRAARSLVLRLVRVSTHHQRQVDQALIEAVADLQRRAATVPEPPR